MSDKLQFVVCSLKNPTAKRPPGNSSPSWSSVLATQRAREIYPLSLCSLIRSAPDLCLCSSTVLVHAAAKQCADLQAASSTSIRRVACAPLFHIPLLDFDLLVSLLPRLDQRADNAYATCETH